MIPAGETAGTVAIQAAKPLGALFPLEKQRARWLWVKEIDAALVVFVWKSDVDGALDAVLKSEEIGKGLQDAFARLEAIVGASWRWLYEEDTHGWMVSSPEATAMNEWF